MTSAKPTPGVDDLATLFPEIAKQWHPIKNGDLRPCDVRSRTNRKVWWQCNNDPKHEWETQVAGRTDPRGGSGCPVCSGKRILIGFNDLETTHPDIASEWHPTKNCGKRASEFSRGSKQRIWWRCSSEQTHEWEAQILSRTQGSGCPFCAGKRVVAGGNDLKSKYPDIAAELHPTKNGGLNASEIHAKSHKKVWWLCIKSSDHCWQASVKSRTLEKSGCPVCSGNLTLAGYNDLLTTHPEIAAEWHLIKNGALRPNQVSQGSNKKVWWKCSLHEDHEWSAVVLSRTFSNSGCPICSGHKTLSGFNDLVTTHPDIARQWHPLKNGRLQPSEVSQGSNIRVWWKCPENTSHQWQTSIHHRVSGKNCPDCAEYGFNTSESAWFYLMNRPGEQQIGITNNLEQRFRHHRKNGWEPLDWTRDPAPGRIVLDTERMFKKWLRKDIGLIKGTAENWATTSMEVQTLAELKLISGIETELF